MRDLTPRPGKLLTLAAAVAALLVGAVVVGAADAAAPGNTTPPAISGTAKVGSTLTVSNGTWTGSPTSYTYQWQRCSSSTCTNIAGETKKTYAVTSTDAGHTLRAVVTATNDDGLSTANSNKTAVVPAASGAPTVTGRPTISGDAIVGESLTASKGQWNGSPTSFGYQWLRCDQNGAFCFAIDGATGSSYGVRTADTYETLRVAVSAKNANGVTSSTSDASPVVQPIAPQTVAGNKRPTLKIRSLLVRGSRVYARFTVCDDSGRISVIERDAKPRQLAYIRKYAVTTRSCVTATRSWTPAPRFRTRGSFAVTLRAVDKSGASSPFVTRSVRWR
jgi:hypothetical protein